ncbi:Growth-regulating factor 6 [Camellia lanceoleosa]|uniref:Growth-regulating factor 6 n=1 Tax=Camellia lanceoleosa TaxID=1840588 RepID=A0ACC0I994_9ERIC|nr:Growth-regulating factor 6 [Camellia lanceoleosa]
MVFPFPRHNRYINIAIGFDVEESNQKCKLGQLKFKLRCLLLPSSTTLSYTLQMYTYSSETGCWTQCNLKPSYGNVLMRPFDVGGGYSIQVIPLPKQNDGITKRSFILGESANGLPQYGRSDCFKILIWVLKPYMSNADQCQWVFRHVGWESFEMGYGRKVDPELGRCRRTDGKKWRCSKEAHSDSKYRERHMHRGRHGSRKLVEVITTTTTNSSSIPPSHNKPKLCCYVHGVRDEVDSRAPFLEALGTPLTTSSSNTAYSHRRAESTLLGLILKKKKKTNQAMEASQLPSSQFPCHHPHKSFLDPNPPSLLVNRLEISWDDLHIKERIGAGSFGIVHRAEWHGSVTCG